MRDNYSTNSHYLSLYISLQKGWENVLFELGSESVKIKCRLPRSRSHSASYSVTSTESIRILSITSDIHCASDTSVVCGDEILGINLSVGLPSLPCKYHRTHLVSRGPVKDSTFGQSEEKRKQYTARKHLETWSHFLCDTKRPCVENWSWEIFETKLGAWWRKAHCWLHVQDGGSLHAVGVGHLRSCFFCHCFKGRLWIVRA